jgi:hypothetical protein
MPSIRSFAAFTIACCVAAGTAHAADPGVVLVVGKAQAKDRTTVASAVRSAARSGGWELIETPLTDPEIQKIVACLGGARLWSCVSPVVEAKGIRRLVIVRVEPSRSPDGAAALALTEQVLLPGSDVTTADQRYCPRCIDETLTRIAFDLTKTLLQEAASGTARTRLTIRSTPPAAWITLDGANVGLTDRTYATFPGRHVVLLQREGYDAEIRTVDAIEDQEVVVAVALRSRVVVAPGGARSSYLVPAVVAGAGAVAVGAGIWLQLAKDPPTSGRQPKYLVSTPGIALMVGGSVAVGVAAYLWLRADRGSAPASALAVSLTPGGGVLGWTGQF